LPCIALTALRIAQGPSPCYIMSMNKALAKPIKDPAKKIVTAIYLDAELRDRVDAFVRDAKTSRSWVISRIIEGFLADKEAGY
jgi:hypothetical protein